MDWVRVLYRERIVIRKLGDAMACDEPFKLVLSPFRNLGYSYAPFW